ncbi:MAG: uracil phosphoribosyltransferase [Chthoniobacterales bacterium]
MTANSPNLHVVDHPLVATKLASLRAVNATTGEFRRALQEVSILLLAEASRTWLTREIEVTTPLKKCTGATLAQPVVLVPILRAGLGMIDGMLQLVPDAQVGHLGLYRDEVTLLPVTYYSRVPADLAEAQVVLADPMLATGQSASEAIAILKRAGARRIQFVCLVACPTGIAQVSSQHPEVPIVAGAVDPELNSVGYIVPGLGDAGDRYFGTGVVLPPP